MYLLVVVSVLMILWGSVTAFTAIANYIFPKVDIPTYEEFTLDSELRGKFQTYVELDIKEMKQVYKDYVKAEMKPHKEQALNELIKSIGWIAIPLPIFIYFQRQLHRRKPIPS